MLRKSSAFQESHGSIWPHFPYLPLGTGSQLIPSYPYKQQQRASEQEDFSFPVPRQALSWLGCSGDRVKLHGAPPRAKSQPLHPQQLLSVSTSQIQPRRIHLHFLSCTQLPKKQKASRVLGSQNVWVHQDLTVYHLVPSPLPRAETPPTMSAEVLRVRNHPCYV